MGISASLGGDSNRWRTQCLRLVLTLQNGVRMQVGRINALCSLLDSKLRCNLQPTPVVMNGKMQRGGEGAHFHVL